MTAEELMRSRYTAFALGELSPHAARHLLESWDPTTRPTTIEFEPGRIWTGLTILATAAGGALDATGTVTFTATFTATFTTSSTAPATTSVTPEAMTETSSFRRREGRWVYLTGIRA